MEHQSTQILMHDSRSHKESISFNLSKGIMASPEVCKSKSHPSIQSLASSSSGQHLASPQERSVRKILHRNKEKHFVSNKDISFQNLDYLFKRRDHEKILITVPNIPASSKPVSDSCFRLPGGTSSDRRKRIISPEQGKVEVHGGLTTSGQSSPLVILPSLALGKPL